MNEQITGNPCEKCDSPINAAPPLPINRPIYTPYVKPKCTYNSTDRLFAVIALVLGFLLIKTAFRFGLLMAIVLLGITVFNYIYSTKSGLKMKFSSIVIFACMAALSISFAISDNNTVKGIDFVIITVSNLYLVYTSHKTKYNTVIIDAFKAVCISPFYEYSSMFGAVFHKEGNETKNGKKEKRNTLPIIFGLLLSIPVTIIAIVLLADSDSTFAGIVEWFGNLDFDQVIFNILLFFASLPVGMYIFGAVYSRAYKVRNDKLLPKNKPVKFDILPAAMCNAFLTPLCVVYAVYMISQVSHFFLNYVSASNHSFDYSSYARQGFFQLCFVTVLNLGVISVAVFFSEHKGKLMSRSSKVYVCVFSLLTIMLIGTALMKMVMYIDFYGLTPLRVYTSVFMIWLFILFAVLMVKQNNPKLSMTKWAYCFAVVIMLAMSYTPVDGLIAKNNVKWYREGKIGWMGSEAIYELDASAVPYLTGKEEREFFKREYSSQDLNIYNFNFTRYFACRLLED